MKLTHALLALSVAIALGLFARSRFDAADEPGSDSPEERRSPQSSVSEAEVVRAGRRPDRPVGPRRGRGEAGDAHDARDDSLVWPGEAEPDDTAMGSDEPSPDWALELEGVESRAEALQHFERFAEAEGGAALRPLLRDLKDSDPQVRARALEAIGGMTGPEFTPLFEALARDEDEAVQAAVKRVLARFDAGEYG